MSEGLGGTLGVTLDMAVRTCDDNGVAVWLAEPELEVISQGIEMERFKNGCASCYGPGEVSFNVLRLEPEDEAIAIRLGVGVAQMRMFMNVPGVELEHKCSVECELLVLWTAVCADEAENALEPSA